MGKCDQWIGTADTSPKIHKTAKKSIAMDTFISPTPQKARFHPIKHTFNWRLQFQLPFKQIFGLKRAVLGIFMAVREYILHYPSSKTWAKSAQCLYDRTSPPMLMRNVPPCKQKPRFSPRKNALKGKNRSRFEKIIATLQGGWNKRVHSDWLAGVRAVVTRSSTKADFCSLQHCFGGSTRSNSGQKSLYKWMQAEAKPGTIKAVILLAFYTRAASWPLIRAEKQSNKGLFAQKS